MHLPVLVILPTYNERENLPGMVEGVLSQKIGRQLHILVVDDNSPDGTGALADSLAAAHPGIVHVLHRTGREGLGRAYVAAFKWALEREYEVIIHMDTDFSHDPAYLGDMLRALQSGADLVLGSRYVQGGGTRNWPLTRRIMSRFGSLYAHTLLGSPYHDLTGGFKAFRREVLLSFDLDSLRSRGYCFMIEMTHRAHLMGFKIKEVPIVFVERRAGASKMGMAIIFEAATAVWRIRRLRAKSPLHKREQKGLGGL